MPDQVLARELVEAAGTAGARRLSESSTTAPWWKSSPSTAPRSSASRSRRSSRSSRAPSSAFRLVGQRVEVAALAAPTRRAPRRRAGCRPHACAIRTLAPPGPRGSRAARRPRAAPSGSSSTVTGQSGRCSSSSGRARQKHERPARRDAAGRRASRSSSAGSAQWMSSTSTTSGRSGRGRARGSSATASASLLGGHRCPRRGRAAARPPDAATGAAPATSSTECVVADPGELAHDLRDRPVRDPLAVGEAGAADDPRARADAAEQLGCEPRLADPGLADDRDQAAAPLGDASVELALEQRELAVRARRAALAAAAGRAPCALALEQPVGAQRLRLPLRLDRRRPARPSTASRTSR